MNRRTVLAVASILAIVLFGGLGTLRARQVLAENRAHSAMVAARSTVVGGLQHARAIGLLAAELAPFENQLHTIDATPSPTGGPLWASDRAGFYDQQASAYRHLRSSIGSKVRAVERAAQIEAEHHLASARSTAAQATTLGLDPGRLGKLIQHDSSALRSTRTPAQSRQISQELHTSAAALAPLITARQHALNGLIASSGNTLDGIYRHADADAAQADSDLALLGILTTRAPSYRSTLSALTQKVHAKTTLTAAAVAALAVDDELARINRDYQSTVPAKLILVSTESQSADYYENGKVIYSTPVTTGGPELPTDHGVFHIYEKISPFVFHSPWPPGSPYYYPPSPVQYWMPFDGQEGLHDASWRSNFGPGSNLQPTDLGTGYYILGTHGCVNLPNDAATFTWNWAPVGTTVVVV